MYVDNTRAHIYRRRYVILQRQFRMRAMYERPSRPGLSPPLPTESERAAELGAALEAAPAPARAFDLRDPKHFPPMRPERADPAAH